jgi:hypothetical protein
MRRIGQLLRHTFVPLLLVEFNTRLAEPDEIRRRDGRNIGQVPPESESRPCLRSVRGSEVRPRVREAEDLALALARSAAAAVFVGDEAAN